MRIRDALGQTTGVQGKFGSEDKKTVETEAPMFGKHLHRLDFENYEQRLASILDKINKQGDKMNSRVDIKDLQIYKKLVSEFLYEATCNSHKFEKQSFLDRRGQHRVFATIKKVNTELEELTQEVLKEEQEHIKVLQKLDDIRGLLLDIMM